MTFYLDINYNHVLESVSNKNKKNGDFNLDAFGDFLDAGRFSDLDRFDHKHSTLIDHVTINTND